MPSIPTLPTSMRHSADVYDSSDDGDYVHTPTVEDYPDTCSIITVASLPFPPRCCGRCGRISEPSYFGGCSVSTCSSQSSHHSQWSTQSSSRHSPFDSGSVSRNSTAISNRNSTRTGDSKYRAMEETAKWDVYPRSPRDSSGKPLSLTLGHIYSSQFPFGHKLCRRFIANYQLTSELGSGGYGFVMSAFDRHSGQEVAVKFIIKDKMSERAWTTDYRGRLIPLEAKILSMLDHDGIIKFIDLYEDGIYFYLVEELHGTLWSQNAKRRSSNSAGSKQADKSESAGEKGRHSRDLFECIERSKYKRLTEKVARYVLSQVVDIVEYMHSMGIAHRDIKDENLVVDDNFKIKLIDFGSAVLFDPGNQPYLTRFCGTSAYASAEVLRRKRYQPAPAEIWTLGILLSFMLTRTSPFKSEKLAMKGSAGMTNFAKRYISDSCFNLMKRCLEGNPAKRATIQEVKAHPWLKGADDITPQDFKMEARDFYLRN